MARAPEVMTETDSNAGDIGAGAAPPGTALPLGLAGGTVSIDVPSSPGTPRRTAAPASPPFEIIETDDDFNLVAPRADGTAEMPPPPAGAPAGAPADVPTEAQRRASTRGERRRQARDSGLEYTRYLETQLEDLRGQFSTIEPRLTELSRARVEQALADADRRIGTHQQAAEAAEGRMAEAMNAADNGALFRAMRERDAAMLAAHQTTVERGAVAAQLAQSPAGAGAGVRDMLPSRQEPMPRVAPPPVPAAVQRSIEDFRDRYPWYQPENRRPDGAPANPLDALVLEADRQVAADGYDPRGADYWEELDARLEGLLPPNLLPGGAVQAPSHARNGAPSQPVRSEARAQTSEPPPIRRGPAVPAASDRAPAQSRNQVYLSPGRREAMILAGALESDGRTVSDRAKFERYLRQYSTFDRDNRVVAR